MGVVALGKGQFAATDSQHGRVVVVSTGERTTLSTEFTAPTGLAGNDDGLIVVDSREKTVARIARRSGLKVNLGSGLPFQDPGELPGLSQFTKTVRQFPGVAVGPSGEIYVGADADGSVLVARGI